MVAADGTLWVTLALGQGIAAIDDGRVRYVTLPCGGTHDLALRADGSLVVTCPNDDRVIDVAPDGTVSRVRPLAGRPLAVAVLDGEVHVGLQREGAVVLVEGGERDLRTLEPETGVHASHPAHFAVDGRKGLVGTYERVEHDSDRARPPEIGGYGSVVDDQPRIDPRLHGACQGSYARFDGGAQVFSGPSGAAWSGERVWLTHRQTDNVALVGCDDGTPNVVASFRVGRGPRGVVVREGLAYVDVGFDHAIAVLDPDETEPLRERRRTLGAARMSELALRGRDLFHDAVDTHLTPSGVAACATCHPGGGDDSLSWFIHTAGIERKLRRTPPAWRARSDHAPFHWDGTIPDIDTLGRETIQELMNGDGLLVDYEALAAYLDEVPAPPRRPVEDDELVAHGQRVFAEAGCVDCHPGGGRDGLAHSVGEPTLDDDAAMDRVDTPTLEAIRARAPFLHDGRAKTLARRSRRTLG